MALDKNFSKSLNLQENINISEYVYTEIELGAVIYRREFEKYHQEYLKSKSGSELIFSFIFLQIYVECFLHQNMRKIVELEFKPPRDGIYTKWLQGEHRYVPVKIEEFATLFFLSVPTNIKRLIDCIKDRFENISDIRNQFVHGHKIATWSDSRGNSGITPARSALIEKHLSQSIIDVNELGVAWNNLLDDSLLQCKALRHVESFKFSNL